MTEEQAKIVSELYKRKSKLSEDLSVLTGKEGIKVRICKNAMHYYVPLNLDMSDRLLEIIKKEVESQVHEIETKISEM